MLLSDLDGGAGVRFAPFYGGMFGDSSRFLWAYYSQVTEADGVGLVGLPARFRVEDGLLVGLLSGGLRGRVLRADVGGRRQPAVPLRVVYFSERKAEYGRVLRTTGGGLE